MILDLQKNLLEDLVCLLLGLPFIILLPGFAKGQQADTSKKGSFRWYLANAAAEESEIEQA